jgi:hypothetical protein
MTVVIRKKSNVGSIPASRDTTPTLQDLRRIRATEFAHLLARGRSAFYRDVKAGLVPPADGHDSRPYWRQMTVYRFLNTGEY